MNRKLPRWYHYHVNGARTAKPWCFGNYASKERIKAIKGTVSVDLFPFLKLFDNHEPRKEVNHGQDQEGRQEGRQVLT